MNAQAPFTVGRSNGNGRVRKNNRRCEQMKETRASQRDRYGVCRGGELDPRSFPNGYCNLAYSSLACFRIGMPGSASFHNVRKSWYAAFALALSPWIAQARARPTWATAPISVFKTTPRWLMIF